MIQLPVQCKNCNYTYPSLLSFENTLNVTLNNNKSQYPICQAMNLVLEGVFNFYSDAIEVLVADGSTV